MRAATYWLPFGIVSAYLGFFIYVLLTLAAVVLMPGEKPSLGDHHRSIAEYVYAAIGLLLHVLIFVLVMRRFYLLARKKESLPATYKGAIQYLGIAATGFVLVAALGYLATYLLRAGSGVPAALLTIPAFLASPLVVLFTEAASVLHSRKPKA